MDRDADDDQRLVEHLVALGATDDEIRRAAASGGLGPLAVDLALRPPGPTTTLDELAALDGHEPELVHRLWRAVGLPDGDPVPADAADALRALLFIAGYLGEQEALAFARVIGGSVATIAAALANATRVGVEVPGLERGAPYSQMVEQNTTTIRELLPLLWDAIGAIFRRHLALVSAQRWRIDDDHTAVTVECTVGFVDVVASTDAIRDVSAARLAELVNRFEQVVWDSVAAHGGRVVKLIGDEAMFTMPSPAAACAFAASVLDDGRERWRIGLSHGTAIAYHGDLYGPTVNLAARLVRAAPAGSALLSESIADVVGDSFAFEPADVGPLRGFPDDTRAFRLVAP